MESLDAYLTKEGWKDDWKQTKQDFQNIFSKIPEQVYGVMSQEESIKFGAMISTAGIVVSLFGYYYLKDTGTAYAGATIAICGAIHTLGHGLDSADE